MCSFRGTVITDHLRMNPDLVTLKMLPFRKIFQIFCRTREASHLANSNRSLSFTLSANTQLVQTGRSCLGF